MSDEPPRSHDPYAPFSIPVYRRYAVGGVVTHLGTRMQSVAVGCDVYQRTGEPLAGWLALYR